MRRIWRILRNTLLLLLAVMLAVAVWKQEEIRRLIAVNRLFAEDRIVANFSAMDRAFLTRPMRSGGGAPLPRGPEASLPAAFRDWLAARQVTGFAVLHRGQVVAEGYRLGTRAEDLRIQWSVSKSVLSLLYGILLEKGAVPPLDTPLVQAVPLLAGSAYAGATLRDAMTMSSGIAFDEDYLDYNSDINRMGRVLALGGSMDGFAAGQSVRALAPGSRWQYVSIDTHVIAMAIRQATGRSLPELMEEHLLRPLAPEHDAYYLTDGYGVAFALGGLNMTTRDTARIGLLVARRGAWEGRQVVPADWIAESTSASAPGGAPYGFQWWLAADGEGGEVFGRGIYGQYLYIHPGRDVVIAVNAADRGFRNPGVHEDNIAMFRAIVEALSNIGVPHE